MKKNWGAVLGLTIIIAALAFSAAAFKTSLVSYVPFTDARTTPGESVQIMGTPQSGSLFYDSGTLHFTLQDEKGQTMTVLYKGPKPDDMDSAMSKATKIGAQGTYDPSQQTFVADSLVVKCPSKYQGVGQTERHYGAS